MWLAGEQWLELDGWLEIIGRNVNPLPAKPEKASGPIYLYIFYLFMYKKISGFDN